MKNSYIILLIAVIGIVLYSYSLGGKFIWDDSYYILRNPSIQSIRNAPSFFTDPSTLAKGKLALENYRPLLTLSYAVDYMFWGLNPFGYHLTNTLFHILNAVLVFLLIKNIAGKETALFTAMLFLAHPVQTEAVSWISGRSNVLFLSFYLAAFILYVRSRMMPQAAELAAPDSILGLYLLSLSLFCLALLSKEAAATLPFIICLYDVILRKKDKKAVFRWIPYFVILVNYLLLRYIMLGKVSQRPYWGESLFQTWLTVPKLIKIYVQMLLFPLNLCVDRHVALVKSLLDMQFLTGLLIAALLLAVFFAGYRKAKTTAFFTAWFFVTLSPFLNIFPINIVAAERFLYLPSIGIFFLFSLAAFKLAGNRGPIFYSAGFVIILILSILTAMRNIEWRDELSLFKSGIKVEPWNARLHHNLGVAYLEEEEEELAEKQFKKAMLLDKNFNYNYISLGKVYFQQGRYEMAEDIVNKGLIIAPEDPELLNVLAVLYIQKDRRDEAEAILRKVIERNPKFFDAHLNLGRLLEENGAYDDAIRQYKDSMRYFNTGYENAILRQRIRDVPKVPKRDVPKRTDNYKVECP